MASERCSLAAEAVDEATAHHDPALWRSAALFSEAKDADEVGSGGSVIVRVGGG